MSATASTASRIRLVREADIRYAGQSMEVRVTAPGGAVDASFLARPDRCLQRGASRTFGYNYAGQQKIELVNFCVSGFGLIERPQHAEACRKRTGKPDAKGRRPVYFGSEHSGTRRSTIAHRCRRAAASRDRP